MSRITNGAIQVPAIERPNPMRLAIGSKDANQAL
jgi:hypothetical protein